MNVYLVLFLSAMDVWQCYKSEARERKKDFCVCKYLCNQQQLEKQVCFRLNTF